MQRNLVITADGSHTVELPALNVSYHSRHGAIRESMHVYLEAGLTHFLRKSPAPGACRIFEMGFGTGLNALLTVLDAEKLQQKICYTAVEAYPLEKSFTDQLNYCEQLSRPDLQPVFNQLHSAPWEEEIILTPFFTLKKIHADLNNFSPDQIFHLIYYDAFAPNAQPELWTEEIFKKLYQTLVPGGILVTYCSKGDVQRAMKAAGFRVEKLPGPPGKREMVRAHSNV